ncbi:non-ribosomal peptide synthetase [Candidatus Megaera polyxenophila]|nr:non-ribosomal peptide synthetase [Candidatus Megaera polyxenophila]
MINKFNIQDLYPLSPIQSGFLFQHLYAPQSDAYFVQSIFLIDGVIETSNFKIAWQKIIDTYSILRTAFLWQDGDQALQYTLDHAEVPFVLEDWQDFSDIEQEERLKDFIEQDRKKGFDLNNVPLIRIHLIQKNSNSYYLVWSNHHILLDGWSSSTIFHNFLKLYRALNINQEFLIKEDKPYRDYIAWLQKQDLTRAEQFWKQYLSSLEEPTYLSFQHLIKEKQNQDYSIYSEVLSLDETKRIKNFAQKHGLTLNTILQGAVAIVVQHYLQQKEIVLGLTVSGRNINLTGIEDMVGLFINTLPLRVQFEENNIISFLKKLQNDTQKINDYTYTQLADIQKWSGIGGDLFNLTFAFENYPFDENDISLDFQIKRIKSIEKTEYPLTIMAGTSKQTNIVFKYQTIHFDEKIIVRFAAHIKMILTQFISKQFSISSLLILEEEEKKLLFKLNHTEVEYPIRCIHKLIEEQVEKTPDNIAVVYGDTTATYQELNEKANRLASYLRSLGVVTETPVAIVMNRSLEMIVAIIAILKAGATYIPIDRNLPEIKRQLIIDDIGSPIVLTDIHNIDMLSASFSLLICIEKETNIIERFSSNNFNTDIVLQNLAYIIYTSGSTGIPKGVMITHESLNNYIQYSKSKYDIANGKVILHSSIAFDMSITSIFLPLVQGDTIEIIAEGNELEDLQNKLQSEDTLNMVKLTPTHLKALRENVNGKILSNKAKLIIGGESLSWEDIKPWLNDHRKIFNEYGPTETTVGCCVYEINHLDSRASVSIGKPIDNMKIYILDKKLNPVPIGVRGEIYISGIGLARGYLNRADLTAERFFANPFTVEGERLYKTGDLGRYLINGNIEYLGRNDEQVKIRGYRIELGEIEAVLNKHRDISAAVVIEKEQETTKSLVAYVVLKELSEDKRALIDSSGKEFNICAVAEEVTESLGNTLARVLPEYMIPKYFVYLNRIPLTSNGKLDRRALPEPEVQSQDSYIAPRTELEKQLCDIWAQVLKLEKISITDNFFKLGGHSLSAMQIVSRISYIYNIDIPLRIIFENPILMDLANSILLSQNRFLSLSVIIPQVKSDYVPLSFAQQRLWFLDQILPDIALYNIPIALKFTGFLDVLALEKALNVLIRRHESLRTIFSIKDGEAYQVILPNLVLDIKNNIIDLSMIEKDKQEAMVDHLAEIEANYVFDLTSGPLIRSKLLILSPDIHIFLMTLHHIISDGWSTAIMFKELSILYNSYLLKKEILLPKLFVQYADFSIWQRSYVTGEVLERQLDYWKQQLADIPIKLNLPTDKVRPKELNYRGKNYRYNISNDTRDKLRNLSNLHQVSLFMVLLSIFKILLHKYTEQNDIIVGFPTSGRGRQEIEGVVGFFVNTLVLRTIFQKNDTFIDTINKVKDTTLKAYQNQDIPFERLVDSLNIPRDININPVFQVMFSFENTTEKDFLSLDGLEFEPFYSTYPIAKFDLSFNVLDTHDGLYISIEYLEDLFEDITIVYMAEHFNNLITKILQETNLPIEKLLFLTDSELELINKWNNTDTPYLEDRCFSQLFEEQVKKTPNNIAVIFNGKALTYKELNNQVNRLTNNLANKDIAPEQIIVVLQERNIEYLISILAILRLGTAFLSIDPKNPIQRISMIINQSLSPYILYHGSIKDKLCLDTLKSSLPILPKFLLFEDLVVKECDVKPQFTFTLNSLTYVIYTSGSTGTPKGVMIDHKGFINHIYAMIKNLDITEKDVMIQNASQNFDISVWQLLTVLLVGGQVVIVSDEDAIDPVRLIQKSKDATILQVVPSMLRMMVDHLMVLPNYFLKLRFILATGEIISKELSEKWFNYNSNIPLINAYGPAECSDDVTLYKIDLAAIDRLHNVPIGKPIMNTKIYILDKIMNYLPIGIYGEIYVSGYGVGIGYLNEPEKTSEVFIANPFVIDDTNNRYLRLYKTGDIGRYLHNGNIEYLGRIDDQIKIRGFRIELGEIENALNKHLAVEQSIVLLKGDVLVAYIALKENSQDVVESFTDNSGKKFNIFIIEPNFSEKLKSYLNTSLPHYMVPTFFIYLDRIPLTKNGKVDKKSLPAINLSLVTETYVAPRNNVEIELCKIWMEVLKLDKVGIYDSFFKLGGHSLLAIQIIFRIKYKYNIDIALKSIFEHPKLIDLANLVITNQTNIIEQSIQPQKKDGVIPLSFAQQRLWFLDQMLPGSAIYNIPIALSLSGFLDINAFEQSLNLLLERHESLRTVFPNIDGKPYQVILPNLYFNTTDNIINLTNLKQTEQQAKIANLVESEASYIFNLAEGPLIRIKLIILTPKEYVFLLTMHHIIGDGWSTTIIFKELSILYNSCLSKNQIVLPKLPIQYADFSIWQRSYIKESVLKKQLNYWKQQLSDMPEFLELATDKIRPRELTYKGCNYHYHLSNEIKDKLKILAGQQEVSLFMIILTAFKILLYKYTEQKDIVVGTPSIGRQYPEIEGVVGFFINTLALRTTFDNDQNFIDILNKVKKKTLQAYQNQDVAFEQIVDSLNVDRVTNRNPIFQIWFTFEGIEEGKTLFLNQVKADTIYSPYAVAKFDLSFGAYESPNGIGIAINYSTDLFYHSTIKNLAEHFKKLIYDILKNPYQDINLYSLLIPEKAKKILFKWNSTEVEYSIRCIHELIEEQVEKTPDNIAVVYGDTTATYQELNEKANRLASYLRSLGVVTETPVAIVMNRSLEMIVAIIAILKAGATYIPIDPDFPKERLKYIVEDTKVLILLTQATLKESIVGLCKIVIEVNAKDFHKYSELNHTNSVSIKNLAYIIYTSGSTGIPKGVMITHESLNNYIQYSKSKYDIANGKVILHSSIAFDMSITSIFLPLVQGDTIEIIAEGNELEDLQNKLQSEDTLNMVKLTPTHLKALRENVNGKILSNKAKLIIGGESLSWEDIKPWLNDHRKIFNEYGPTETTVGCCVYEINHLDSRASVSIGKPIDNMKIYILDKKLNPVPIGVRGEIYISGIGLARGYLNRADLTAERFFANPFTVEGERLYKTGDLGRYLINGNIEYLGRNDEQVKIRGYRIELGEIEAVLNKHGDISAAVVIEKEQETTKSLVAYVVAGNFIPSDVEIKNYLIDKLPEYMIPKHFVYLNRIPLTSNGKLDRRALPEPEVQSQDSYIAPRTELEKQLCDIWAQVLKLEKISITDNFFRIGGDSIISIQVMSKARQKGIYFSVKDIFSYPSVIELTVNVKTEEKKPKIDQTLIKGKIMLTPIQHWFFAKNLPNNNYFNQSILLQPKKKLQLYIIKQSFMLLRHHHDILRCCYNNHHNQWQQICLQEEIDTVEYIDLSVQEDETDITTKIENYSNKIQASLDINKGIIMKVLLFDLVKSQRLLIVVHHLVIDSVSWRILLEDLESFYSQLEKRSEVQFPNKTYSYKQWSQILADYAYSATLKKEIPYWQELEKNIQPIETDFNLGAYLEINSHNVEISLNKDKTLALLQKVHKAYRTEISDILLTALVLGFGDLTGNYTLNIAFEGHGREEIIEGIDLSRTIGWFTTIFPVVLVVDNPNDLERAIKIIKENIRTIPNKGIGYGIIKHLRPKVLTKNKSPQIIFNYLGRWDNVTSLNNLFSFAPESSGRNVAQENILDYVISINAEVKNDIMHFFWTASSNHYYPETINKIVHYFIQRLNQLIEHCCQDDVYGYTPSDFDLVTLKQDQLEKILLEIKKK